MLIQKDPIKSKQNTKQPNIKNIFINVTTNSLYSWAFPIFYKGFRKQLNEDDLYETLHGHESTILGNRLEEAWREEEDDYKNPSLWRALWKVFGNELLGYGIVLFFYEVLMK